MATAYFMRRIIEMTDAKTDQENIEMVIYNVPSIPDRTGYILDNTKESPLPKITELAGKIQADGADYIAIPCVTAHYFHKAISDSVDIPVSNGIKEAAEYLKKAGIKKVGIMATDGTASTRLFDSVFMDYGITCIYPRPECQKLVMSIIYDDIKAGHKTNMEEFYLVKEDLFEQGAKVVILGCTELSVVKRDRDVGDMVLDIIDVLAADCVSKCAKLRDEYKQLITGLEFNPEDV